MLIILQFLVNSYRQAPFRIALVGAALLAASAGLSAVLTINHSAHKSFQNASQPMLRNIHFKITATDNGSFDKSVYSALRRSGLVTAIPVLSVQANLSDINEHQQSITLYGIDSFALMSLAHIQQQPLIEQQDSTFSLIENTIIHAEYAKRLNINDKQVLTLNNGKQLPPIHITNQDGLADQLIVDIAVLHQLTTSTGVSTIYIAEQLSAPQRQQINNLIDKFDVQLSKVNAGEDASQLTDSFQVNLLAMALLMFVVCMFVVMNALTLLQAKRQKNLMILRQLGLGRRLLLTGLLVECLLLCVFIVPLGTLLGIESAKALSPVVQQTMRSLYDVYVGYESTSLIMLTAKTMVVCLLGAGIAISFPLLTTHKQLSHRHDISSVSPNERKWLIYALLLLCIAALAVFLTETTSLSFIIIALIIFAGCCWLIYILPVILTMTKSVIPQYNPLIQLGIADSLRISHHSKIAFCAFFIAISTHFAMNLMVDSFRNATESWLQKRLNAQAYLFVDTKSQSAMDNLPINDITLVERRTIDSKVKGQTIETVSFANHPRQHNSIAFHQQTIDAWSSFDKHQAIFVNQQFAYMENLSLRDSVTLEFPNSLSQQFVITGIYYDFGNPLSQILLPLSYLSTLPSQHHGYAIYADSNSFVSKFEDNLKANNMKYRLFDADNIMQLSMKTFDQTFVITNSLNIVTLLVAAFSLATSVLLLEADNRPTKSLMRSLGISNQAIFKMSLSQFAGLTTITGLLAIPFGIVLSWLLINLVNVRAFHWSYPLLINWQNMAYVLFSSVIIVLMITSIPLIIERRRSLSQLLAELD